MQTAGIRLFRIVTCMVFLALVPVGSAPGQNPGAGDARVKVHKNLVSVMPSAGGRAVTITGSAGAIDSSSPAELKITNLSTNDFIEAQVQEDGSFRAEIEAVAADQIQVLATNEQGKKSRGTFRVPPAVIPAGLYSPVKPMPAKKEAAPPPKSGDIIKDQQEARELTVLVVVLDKTTGEILSSQTRQIAAQPDAEDKEENFYSELIEKIADQCVRTLQEKLKFSKEPNPTAELQANPESVEMKADSFPDEPNKPVKPHFSRDFD